MVRKVKVDNALLKRFAREETRRSQDVRIKRRYYLIVCEGTKTEPNYFEGLKRNLPQGTLNTIDLEIKGIGRDPLSVVNEAQTERVRLERLSGRIFDEVWAVFDRDNFLEQNFNNAIAKGRDTNIYCAWTNEAFELWYLLHFQFFQNGMSRDDYKAIIERELTQRTGKPFNYKKNSGDMFALLDQYGDIKQAVVRAKQLETVFADRTDYANHNPCTTLHQLVEKLLFSRMYE